MCSSDLAGRFADGPVTVVAVPDGRALLVSAPAGVDATVEEGTEAFARVMLPMSARFADEGPAGAIDAFVGHVGATVAGDGAARLAASQGRQRNSAGIGARCAAILGAVFASQEEVLSFDPLLPPVLRACRHVAVASGVALSSIPRGIPEDPLLGEIGRAHV